jgi:1-acyl-sn-glycerol-3-phosphate acyltransferase
MIHTLRDTAVTVLLWSYFTIAYLALFLPRHLVMALVCHRDCEAAFQRINSRFYGGFFTWLRWLAPRLRLEIAPQVRRLRAAVLVCNHRSYLDPLLFIALFPRHRTIVAQRFFRLPLFGWVLRHSGYLPAGDDEGLLRQVESMPQFLRDGGVLFVFPEGRRGVGGAVGPFATGAFRIARRCHAPLALLAITGSDALFHPGRWRFATGQPVTLRLELVDMLAPSAACAQGPVSRMAAEARTRLQRHLDGRHAARADGVPASGSSPCASC